jgi:histidinol-phosphate aminotransferase
MDIEPYRGGLSKIEGKNRVIKLSSNEGALGPSPMAVRAYENASAVMHRYPDGGAEILRAAIGEACGLDPARIVCGAGSDELICNLCRAYAGPGDEVIYSEHGFLMYAIYAKSVGATPVAAPETDLTANPGALLGRVTAKTRILFLANPNNPTGSYLRRDTLDDLRARLRGDVLLVIDAAYAEYLDAGDYDPGAALVDASVGGGDNVVMTRTFSKIYAMGGLRLGWAYCPPPVAGVLNRLRGPFNVSAPAQAAGTAALADKAFIARSKAHNDAWLPWTRIKLIELGLDVPPSAGNFLLVRFAGGDAAAACDRFLQDRGIIVRRMGAYGLADSLRVSIGTEEEMRAFIEATADFMKVSN